MRADFIFVLQVALIKSLLLKPEIGYICTGKLQTDQQEANFGLCRQIMGANYNLSHLEVCVYYWCAFSFFCVRA